jgi:hypothetical protein
MSIIKRHLAEQEERLSWMPPRTKFTFLQTKRPTRMTTSPCFRPGAKGTIKGTAEQVSRPRNPFSRTNDRQKIKSASDGGPTYLNADTLTSTVIPIAVVVPV